MRVWGVVGWKNTGKTGLVERLVTEIASRGLTVSTLKHAHHVFDVDRPGTDSHRHRQAGASEVLIASDRRWALMHEGAAPPLTELIARLSPVDVVIVEGWKREALPKIETHRAAAGQPLIAPGDPSIRAVASDSGVGPGDGRPVFDLDDTAGIADFMLADGLWSDGTG